MRLPRLLRENLASVLYTILLGMLPLLMSSTITYCAVQYEPMVQRFSLGTWAWVYVLSCVTMAFALTPTTFIALLSGYFLGWQALLPVALSYLVASGLGFYAARSLDQGRLLIYLTRQEKVRIVVERLKTNQFTIIVLARLSPVLPFAVTNVLLSLAGARWRAFLTAGFLGMLPRTLLSLWVGAQARQIRALLEERGGNYWLQVGLGVLVLISIGGLYLAIRRAVQSRA